jgi:ribosomal protein S18 acetylase RimI-like enzyme
MRKSVAGGFELDDDRSRIDIAAAHDFLSNHAPWALGWSFEEIARLFREAQLVVGLYRGEWMIGVTRTVSDGHWLTYLADVYVLPEFRGLGLGHELVRTTIEEGPYAHLGWLLHTAEASSLYKKFGFVMRSDYLMERPAP